MARYFTDTNSIKRFIGNLINKREAGEITSQEFRDLCYAANILLKVFIQLWHEKELIPITKRLELLEDTDGEI
jgi:hypothetical protein